MLTYLRSKLHKSKRSCINRDEYTVLEQNFKQKRQLVISSNKESRYKYFQF